MKKKIKKLAKKNKKKKVKKFKKALKKVKKSPKKFLKEAHKLITKCTKKSAEKLKKAKINIQNRIAKLQKSGKGDATKLKKSLKKIIKKQIKCEKKRSMKKINKIKKPKRGKNQVDYKAPDGPSRIMKPKFIIPKGFVNIIGKSGHCLSNASKPVKTLCGNQTGVVWKFFPVGVNEYNIKTDSGIYLTNKGGKDKQGNPIIAIKPPKAGRDKSNIWSVTPIGNGEYIVYNTFTRKCTHGNDTCQYDLALII